MSEKDAYEFVTNGPWCGCQSKINFGRAI